jgi:hypothetical protein
MTTIINAVASSGLTQTADGSGIVKLQSNGVTTNALAWIKWQYDTGSVVVKSQYNVSSVTLSSSGLWNIAFTSNTSDANYSIVGTATNNSLIGNWGMCLTPDVTFTQSISNCRVATVGGGGSTLYNSFINSVVIFGN